MAPHANPFIELDVTEKIPPAVFTKIFSPLLVPDTLGLFQSGNIVLTGVQGCGKSMLLALLKPEIRIAYALAAEDFPVPVEHRRFIGAGINLTRAGAPDFGNRPIVGAETEALPVYFADFVNYWIVRDMLESISLLSDNVESLSKTGLGLNAQPMRFEALTRRLSKEDCWFGFFEGVRSYSGFRDKIAQRIQSYRRFLNYNIDEIPRDVRETKTSIGEPIARVAEALWEAGIVPEAVPFFVRIDQYEELAFLERHGEMGRLHQHYRQVINKLIAKRDPRVSYRLVSRTWAWQPRGEQQIFGTSGSVEQLRNYRVVNLDELLARAENTTWSFPNFAGDVFRKRLAVAGYQSSGDKATKLRDVFGRRATPEERVRMYVSRPGAVVKVEPEWPLQVRRVLEALAETKPLSAKLGEAWVRQQLNPRRRGKTDEVPRLPSPGVLPWEEASARWWRKERVAQALLQIAAQNGQKMIWSGEQDLLSLSGGNVLAFISVCRFVWSAWRRSLPESDPADRSTMPPQILDPYVQTEGIEEASRTWYEKVSSDPDGDSRRRFATLLGKTFRQELRGDRAMSYPGSNGFSLSRAELESAPEILEHLRSAVEFGVLVERRHTSKAAEVEERRKWYLNPILSPYFQIPVAHTKEPIYASIDDLRKWLTAANVALSVAVAGPQVLPRSVRVVRRRQESE